MNKSEIKYIIFCTLFAAVYFLLALPWLIKTINGNILMQFAIFDVGLIVLLNIYLKSRSTGTRINFIKSMEYMLIILASAVFLPPYSVTPWNGEVIQGNMVLATASLDYFFATMGQQYLHIPKGIFTSIWTFLIVPAVLFFIASKISKSSFVSHV